jgi:hypothetical protein
MKTMLQIEDQLDSKLLAIKKTKLQRKEVQVVLRLIT